MKRRRLAGLLVGVILGLGLMVGSLWLLSKALGERETLYRGQPVYYWMRQISSVDPMATNEAASVFASNILPHLTEVMFHDTNDSHLRMTLIDNLNELPGIHIYFTPAGGRRARAAGEIGDFGPVASRAVPAMLQALRSNDSDIHGPIISALGKIHVQAEEIVPLLIEYLSHEDVREYAAGALGGYGPAAKAAVPKLLPLVQIPDKELHRAVVDALKKIDPEALPRAAVK